MISHINPDQVSRLSGEMLDMICIDSTQIYFHFGLKNHILLEGRYRLYDGSGQAPEPIIVPQMPSELLGPIDQDVVNCVIDAGQTLWVRFANGWVLEAFADDAGYQAYQVVMNGVELFSA